MEVTATEDMAHLQEIVRQLIVVLQPATEVQALTILIPEAAVAVPHHRHIIEGAVMVAVEAPPAAAMAVEEAAAVAVEAEGNRFFNEKISVR